MTAESVHASQVIIYYLCYQISAQESRRKKKEFVDTLEQKVSLASAEVDAYKKRCELLQKQNASLMTQLNNLRALLVNQSSSSSSSGSTASLIGGVASSTTSATSNFISTSSSINGIVKTEPTTIPTNSIKIEPDCKFTKYHRSILLLSLIHI